MAFRYINPGYGSLTDDSSVETFESFIYNPQNGVAFQKTASDISVDIHQPFSSDIYGKFNLYFDSSDGTCGGFSLGADSFYPATYFINRCVGVCIRDSKFYIMASGNSRLGSGIRLKNNALNIIWFHVHVDSAAFGTINVNGTEETITFNPQFSLSADKKFGMSFGTAGYYCGDKIFISELIISDEEISPKEKIIALPVNATTTDMTAGASGIYLADVANQTLLQSVDVSNLIEQFGASSAVTGIALVGNPAYATGTGITSLTGLSSDNGVVTEHDSCNLSEDSNSCIMDGWGLSGVNISDLQHMQFGWKAGV